MLKFNFYSVDNVVRFKFNNPGGFIKINFKSLTKNRMNLTLFRDNEKFNQTDEIYVHLYGVLDKKER